MQCCKVKKLLSAYVNHDLGAHETSGIRTHLQSCDDCSNEHASLVRMLDTMKMIPIPEPAPSFWGMLPDRVRYLLEERHIITGEHSVRGWFIRYMEQWRPLLLGAALTSVVFLVIPVVTNTPDAPESEASHLSTLLGDREASVRFGYMDIDWQSKEMEDILSRLGVNHKSITELKTIRSETADHSVKLLKQKKELLRNIHSYQLETNGRGNFDEAMAELGRTEQKLLQLKSEEAKKVAEFLGEKDMGRLVVEWDVLLRNKKLNQNGLGGVQKQEKGEK